MTLDIKQIEVQPNPMALAIQQSRYKTLVIQQSRYKTMAIKQRK